MDKTPKELKKQFEEWYDKHTEEEANRWEELMRKDSTNPQGKSRDIIVQMLKDHHKREPTEQEIMELSVLTAELFSITTPIAIKQMRKKQKPKRVKAYVEKELRRQKREEDFNPAVDIKCPACESIMAFKHKHLESAIEEKDDRILVLYECPKCTKRRFIYDNGEVWVSNLNNKCSVCGSEKEHKTAKGNDGVLYVMEECPNCKKVEVSKY